jgi:hypothetical protein
MPFGSEDTAIFFRDGSVAVLADGSTARVHLDYPEPIEDFAGTSLPGQIVGKPVMTFPTGLLVNRDDAINVGGTDYKVRTVRKIADGLLSVAELKLAAILLFALLLPALARAQRMPDRDLTPGVVAITDARQVCSIRWGKDERHVTPAMKRAVYAAYGVNPKAGICRAHRHGKAIEHCEIDHLVSRENGGADDPANLWPQPYHPGPGAHEKDKLENWMHREVCAGRLSLAAAQRELANDWYAAYRRMEAIRGR